MTKFLFNFLIFSFLFVSSDLFGDSVTTVKSGERFTVLSKIITTDKYSTFRAILTGPFNGGYGYDSSVSILINGQSSNYFFGNGNSSLQQSGGIDKTFVIPPGLIHAAFSIAEANAGSTYTYDLILINSCPSTAECSSITCPYCKTVYCRVHSQHYSITFKSDHCKINMHTFCTDNQAAANEYNSAQKTATCSLCNASYCKLCGHTCGSLNEGCPNLQDCHPKSCATCKSTYCETHSFHLCSPVGNNNNNSGGSWSVWTEQVGTTENVNVQADFTPLVNAQNTTNTLLNNIKSSLPGFVTDINNTINDGVNSITSSLSGIDSNTSSIASDTSIIAYNSSSIASDTSIIADNSTSIANNFEKLLNNSSSVITKLTDINTLFSTSNKTLTDQLETQNSINVKLTASNANLTSINTLAKLINTDVSKLKSILSDEIVVGLAHHLVELKKQTNLSEKDAVIQNAIKDFLENNVHPALKDTKTFQDLVSSDLTLLLADLENLRTNSDSIIEHITHLKDNSDHKKSILENLLNNSNFMRLDVSSIKSNTDDIKNKTDDIKNNTDSIKSDVASSKLNTDAIKDLTAGIKSTADGIKSTADGIKSTADGINDKLTAQGKTLDDINRALSPSASSNRIQNVDFVPVTPETKYEQKHGPISPDHNISTDKVKQKSEDFKSKFENLPKITAPNYKPLVLNFPLSTDFYDFSFNLDLNGGSHAATIASAKSLSYSIFSCFWVITFSFLFIKSLRQW